MTKYHVIKKKALGSPHGARAAIALGGKIFISMKDKKLLMVEGKSLEVIGVMRT